MRNDIPKQKDNILKWVSEGLPKAEIARRLKCRVVTLNTWLDRLGIRYSGNQGGKGYRTDPKYIPALEYLKLVGCKPYNLKLKLLREGIKDHKCEECLNVEWNGHIIPLEIEHIDGDRWNNELENIKLLCPNCHALTATYCRKKKR